MMTQSFFWYELITPDPKAAATFYETVVGWTPKDFPGSYGDYVVLHAQGDHGQAGIMAPPRGAEGMPSQWLGYIHARDVDAKAGEIAAAGGHIHKAPQDIPGVGRFAVASDPQGVGFMIMAPQGEDRPPLAVGMPGTIGWHELNADDPEAAFDFYSGLFGWKKGEAIPMGGFGTYQLFTYGTGDAAGGIMAKMPGRPAPCWLFYFTVESIAAARQRVLDAGGSVTTEPMEVPGGGWAMEAVDPQGASFGLTSPNA